MAGEKLTVSSLRAEAKARYSRGKGEAKLKGYSKMSRAELAAKLGKSLEDRKNNRAVASSRTADIIAKKVFGGNPDGKEEQVAKAKERILKAVKRDVDAARKANPNISQDELRKVAGKAFVKESKALKTELTAPATTPKNAKKAKAKAKASDPQTKVNATPEKESKPKKEVSKPANEKPSSTSSSGKMLESREYNPHAIKDATPDDFANFLKARELVKKHKGAETPEIKKAKAQVEKYQKALDHPIMTDEEAKGFKPKMSTAEAEAYVKGSYTGNLSFYHGNAKWVGDSIESGGLDPEKNTRGVYGKGGYLATSPDVSSYYALTNPAHAGKADAAASLLETKVKVKNPLVISSTDWAKASTKFPGDGENGVDSTALQEFARVKGHDSIYLSDKGYFVTFDKRQTVVTKKEDFTKNDSSWDALKKSGLKFVMDGEDDLTKSSESFKTLSKAKPTKA